MVPPMSQLDTRVYLNSVTAAFSSSSTAVRVTGTARPATLYSSLLRLPMTAIAGNVSDRADVSSVAILGYN
jgi:hypothetical protein